MLWSRHPPALSAVLCSQGQWPFSCQAWVGFSRTPVFVALSPEHQVLFCEDPRCSRAMPVLASPPRTHGATELGPGLGVPRRDPLHLVTQRLSRLPNQRLPRGCREHPDVLQGPRGGAGRFGCVCFRRYLGSQPLRALSGRPPCSAPGAPGSAFWLLCRKPTVGGDKMIDSESPVSPHKNTF